MCRNGNYDVTDGAYTAPADGAYSFWYRIKIRNNLAITPVEVAVRLAQYKAAATSPFDFEATDFKSLGSAAGGNDIRIYEGFKTFIMNAGDKVYVEVERKPILPADDLTPIYLEPYFPTQFTCVGTEIGGGQFVALGTNVLNVQFSGITNTTPGEFKEILENPFAPTRSKSATLIHKIHLRSSHSNIVHERTACTKIFYYDDN